jgi:hypothetical protein
VIKKYYEQPKGNASEGRSSTKQTPAPVAPKAVETKAVATPKAVANLKCNIQRKLRAPKKGIDAALDGLE